MKTSAKNTQPQLDEKTLKALAKEKAKQEKEVIANSKVKGILNADLDNKNLMDELAKITITDPNSLSGNRVRMYRFNTLIEGYDDMEEKERKVKEKLMRKKIRKTRNNFFNQVLFLFKSENQKELKGAIKSFMEFYKETYLVNDLTLSSIVDSRTDKDMVIKATLFLQVIKNNK